jgi:hypothetical protein
MPELVPGPLWGRSAYRMLGSKVVWKKQIRGDALSEASNRCSICGSEGQRLVCHDKWKYDDKQATATLIGFQINCGDCDAVTHIGMSVQISQREEVMLSAVAHLCTVNQCTPEVAVNILTDALAQWEKRNKKKWRVRVAPALVKKYPELAALPKFVPPPANY